MHTLSTVLPGYYESVPKTRITFLDKIPNPENIGADRSGDSVTTDTTEDSTVWDDNEYDNSPSTSDDFYG
jgi:hypothetical protein